MGNKCSKKLRKVDSKEEDLSPPIKLPTVKKQSIVRTTDDMPNKLFMPLQINPPIIEKKSLNSLDNAMFLPPRTPRTIIHTSSLQKRRNSEVF